MNHGGQTIQNAIFILLYTIVFVFAASKNVCARRYFHIEKPKLGLGFSCEVEEEKRIGPFANTKDVTQEFKERLEIETSGWVYHPALCVYTLRFEPEWTQTKVESDPGRDGKTESYLPGYFIDATFLQRKPYTLQVFGNRSESTIKSAFAGKSKYLADTYGSNLMLKNRILPTTFRYTHQKSTQSGFYTSADDNDEFRISTRHNTPKSGSKLDAAFNDNRRISQGVETRTKTSNGNFQNTYHITEDKRIRLQSNLSGRQTESDRYTSSDVRLYETLYWKHRQNLKSNYRISYNSNTSEGSNNETTSLGARLTHVLYENLTTTIAGNGSTNKYTGGGEKIYGGNLDFDYRRKIPWGVLNATMAFDYDVTQRDFTGNIIPVTDEPHVLKTGTVTLLNNEYIITNSTRVTDSTRATVYIEDTDYRLDDTGTFKRITRIPSGSIADGQPVLVSYSYLKEADYDDSVFGQSYGMRLFLWSALRLSYRYHHAQQKILSGTPPDILQDDTGQSAEMKLDWRWTETTLSYDDIDSSSGISSTRWSAEEILTFRPAMMQIFFRFSGLYGNTMFKERNDTEVFYTLRANLDWLPAGWCIFRLEGIRNYVSGELQKMRELDLSASVELPLGIWSSRIKYDFLETKDMLNADNVINHTLLFEIIRIRW